MSQELEQVVPARQHEQLVSVYETLKGSIEKMRDLEYSIHAENSALAKVRAPYQKDWLAASEDERKVLRKAQTAVDTAQEADRKRFEADPKASTLKTKLANLRADFKTTKNATYDSVTEKEEA